MGNKKVDLVQLAQKHTYDASWKYEGQPSSCSLLVNVYVMEMVVAGTCETLVYIYQTTRHHTQ
jgi:hypothetical protein